MEGIIDFSVCLRDCWKENVKDWVKTVENKVFSCGFAWKILWFELLAAFYSQDFKFIAKLSVKVSFWSESKKLNEVECINLYFSDAASKEYNEIPNFPSDGISSHFL